MTHITESSFGRSVVRWFERQYGADAVSSQVYQPEPRWFCDVVVVTPYATLFIELESRASAVRPGIAQALGYAADDPISGIPMVITPKGHLTGEKIDRLRRSTTVVVREFDEAAMKFV